MTTRRAAGRPGTRRGHSLVEVIASAVLLGLTMSIALSAVAWSAADRRRLDRRRVADREVADAMESVASRPWSELEPGSARAPEIGEAALRALPDARSSIDVADDGPGLRRVRVELRWRDGSTDAARPSRASLTTWVARRGGTR